MYKIYRLYPPAMPLFVKEGIKAITTTQHYSMLAALLLAAFTHTSAREHASLNENANLLLHTQGTQRVV
jgi:hypothetical protein